MVASIIYIADIDQDIDDIIAVDYLKDILKCVVLDPEPVTELGKQRVTSILDMGIPIEDELSDCDLVLVGGAFTKLANYIKTNTIECMVANGGYVGSNILSKEESLKKFHDLEYVRTYNFNLDAESADYVLNSSSISRKYLVGKNVCHSEKNTVNGIWSDFNLVLSKYNLSSKKRLHDLLMVKEGLYLYETGIGYYLDYINVTPVHTGLCGKYTHWGSLEGGNIISARNWKY